MTTDHFDEAVLLIKSVNAIAMTAIGHAHELTDSAQDSLWWGIHHLANEASAALDAEAEETSAEARGGFIHLEASQ